MEIEYLKASHVASSLNEILFRSNTEQNTKFTMGTIPLEILKEKAKMPKFLLNAINFDYLKHTLNSYTYPQCVALIEQLEEIAKEPLQTVVDEYSYWLIEVEPDVLNPILDYIENTLKHDIATIDFKLKAIQNRYQSYTRLGIHTKNDLVQAMNLLQNDLKKAS